MSGEKALAGKRLIKCKKDAEDEETATSPLRSPMVGEIDGLHYKLDDVTGDQLVHFLTVRLQVQTSQVSPQDSPQLTVPLLNELNCIKVHPISLLIQR